MSYQRMAQIPLLQGDNYWLAEPQTGLLATLYKSEPNPDPIQLFEGTPFSAQASQSPILFTLSAEGSLPTSLAAEPTKLKGLLVATQASRPVLLEQLRALLEARFLQGRKALLRYYDPRVASYLLPTWVGNQQANWLGPVSEIAWYGGTWTDKAEGMEQWHLLRQEKASISATSIPLSLNDVQLHRFVDQSYEHFAYQWLEDRRQYEMPQVLEWVRAGLAAGHADKKSLIAWLDSQVMMQGEQLG